MNIETHLSHARKMKEGLVAREGVGADIQPQLVLRQHQQVTGVLVMPGLERERLHANLGLAVALTDADEVVLFHEGFGVTDPDIGEYERHGSLAERFGAGDQAVHELVLVSVVTAISNVTAEQGYTYRGRTIEWKAPTIWKASDEVGLTGALPDVLRAGFRFRSEREGPAMSALEVGSFLGVLTMGVQ